MRDYLFRAKSRENGNWYIGDLVRLKDGADVKTYIYGQGEILPGTVCQMLDIKDCNDNPIFEGDILRISGVIDDEKYQDVMQVYYDNQLHGYLMKATYCPSPTDIDGLGDCGETFEVIGNVFDQAYLLDNDKPAHNEVKQ